MFVPGVEPRSSVFQGECVTHSVHIAYAITSRYTRFGSIFYVFVKIINE